MWLVIFGVSIQGEALAIFLFEWVSPSSFNMKRRPPPGHHFSLFRSYWLAWATLFSASVTTGAPLKGGGRSNIHLQTSPARQWRGRFRWCGPPLGCCSCPSTRPTWRPS